ncbi:energy transducer TonB [Neolewinella aurantiaca]|uniref:Energy transducer TonB n=1 Tax=Neolewinella aurantiaca TaxID=2602767 RepID=A0A5C7FTV3_9BACT|nr:energy transducer TonB [Neolewinella aurantiaca]TXF89700.1 energy transducer TonB [Neolewinella aurantiaca]
MAKNRPSHVSRPVYPGGVAAMKKFVAANLKYPPAAIEAKVEGTVIIRYGLNYTGKVTQAKVKKGIGHGCDEEAMRVVKLMKFTVPQSSKKKVRIHQDVNIHFKLPKPKPTPKPKPAPKTSTSITYTQSGSLSGKVVRKKTTDNKPNSGYSYTIEW